MSDFLTLDQWQRFVESHPDSTVFHHRNWIGLLSGQYGMPCRIPAVRRGGEVVAAIPFLETKGLLGKRKLVSLPFSDTVPMLHGSADAIQQVTNAVRAESNGHAAVVVRSDEPLGGAACTSDQVRHTLDVGRPFEEIQRDFHPSVVRNFRRAESRGLHFRCRTDGDALAAFYRLHLMTRRKLGVPIQPKQFFARLLETFLRQGLGCVAVVTKDDAPIAAGVFLKYKRSVIYKYGASHPAALVHRPNEFLFHHALRWASDQGGSRFDFGVSDRAHDGLRRFKSKWGATETDAYHVYLAGEPSPQQQRSRALKMVSFVIRRSPPAVCRLLGEAFYKYSQ